METLKARMVSTKITVQPFYEPPPWNDGWDGDGYKVTLRRNGRRLTVPFWKGYGHNGKEPDAEEIMECLLLDASGYENAADFEEWCNEYGYSDDSRKAHALYKRIRRGVQRLQQFLGTDFGDFLWETES